MNQPQSGSSPEVDLEIVSEPAQSADVDRLLELVTHELGMAPDSERQTLEVTRPDEMPKQQDQTRRLGVALAQAFSEHRTERLHTARGELQQLTDGTEDLSDNERRLARIALAVIDERLRLNDRIAELQRKIDSLTEIEATLENGNNADPAGQSP